MFWMEAVYFVVMTLLVLWFFCDYTPTRKRAAEIEKELFRLRRKIGSVEDDVLCNKNLLLKTNIIVVALRDSPGNVPTFDLEIGNYNKDGGLIVRTSCTGSVVLSRDIPRPHS